MYANEAAETSGALSVYLVETRELYAHCKQIKKLQKAAKKKNQNPLLAPPPRFKKKKTQNPITSILVYILLDNLQLIHI